MKDSEKTKLFGSTKVSTQLDFAYNSDADTEHVIENMKNVSISGVQDKLSAVIDNERVRLTSAGEQGRYIIKPAPARKDIRYVSNLPANEHLTMRIASEVYKIETAENGLITFSNGEKAYITKRFDILDDGSKLPQEDFASLTSKTSETIGDNFKYTGSYKDIAVAMDTFVASSRIDKERFFKLVLFNYLYGNGDAHLKNFSVLQTTEGDYRLSPAYDLINTAIHGDEEDFALQQGLSAETEKSDIYKEKHHPCQSDFFAFGRKIGLRDRRISTLMAPFLKQHPQVEKLIDASELDNVCKRRYKAVCQERFNRFIRIPKDEKVD